MPMSRARDKSGLARFGKERSMAVRIHQALIRGEIDSRTEGRVTGTLWLVGREAPVRLDLKGNPWRDLAGCLVRFTNPRSGPDRGCVLADLQEGVVGDITASRKVRTLSEPDPAHSFAGAAAQAQQWSTALYLEWFSERNGRVVIESAGYMLEIDGAPAWSMTEAQERVQHEANKAAMHSFLQRLGNVLNLPDMDAEEAEDQPTSQVEAEADAEAARMNLLMDRIMARMERMEREGAEYDRIYREESEKLRRERGEPEPEPLTPEQEEEQSRWIDEMNAAAEEALREDGEQDDCDDELASHPLVDHCRELGVRMYHEVENAGWVPEGAPEEHPLRDAVYGVEFASAKLAGALSGAVRREQWPPDPLFAGDTLVRLKKARNHLRDALAGLNAADEQRLAEFDWRVARRAEVTSLLQQVDGLIREVRESLQ